MPEKQELEFKVVKEGGVWGTPRWEEVAAKNATCPRGHLMVAVNSADMLYAFCHQCNRYYVAK
jgi:hypothetical protein